MDMTSFDIVPRPMAVTMSLYRTKEESGAT